MEILADIRVTLPTFSAIASANSTWRLAFVVSVITNYRTTKCFSVTAVSIITIIIFPSREMSWICGTSIGRCAITVGINSAVPAQCLATQSITRLTEVVVTVLGRAVRILIAIASIRVVSQRLVDWTWWNAWSPCLVAVDRSAVTINDTGQTCWPVPIFSLIEDLAEREGCKYCKKDRYSFNCLHTLKILIIF